MTLACIAIGSNLASPLEQVNAAVKALGEIPQSRIVAVSSFYRTPPLGPQDQPDYLNAAVLLETALDAEALLDNTQRIELQQGRVVARPGPLITHGQNLVRIDLVILDDAGDQPGLAHTVGKDIH